MNQPAFAAGARVSRSRGKHWKPQLSRVADWHATQKIADSRFNAFSSMAE